ncbi:MULTISPECIES: PIN domain nuclease [unclassified Frankia]|uniref:PIN domain nuclease n=1 Tax=unclassified Frankia TaxID=2632575 RepID=UPI001934310A|nr:MULTISPECIES: PIN domain nuclease [unclassified Frankia]MBL7625445.1 PIN domain nuclease [Frankia sp. AgB1.8]
MTESWLLDKSALVRIPNHPDEPLWSERVDQGRVHVCAVTLLEIGYSARNGASHARLLGTPPLSRMIHDWETAAEVTRRAFAVQGMLAAAGHHRAPSIPDLLIAATAELAGHTVLHHDKDFELIADLTRQPVYRLA